MGFVDDGISWGSTVPTPFCAVPGWRPGISQVSVDVVCCPTCGSTEVRHKGHREAGTVTVYWACKCGARWKGMQVKAGRAIIVR